MDDTQELTLTVDDLLLDVRNPRLGSVESQSEALEAIINLSSDYVRVMMLSIIKKGLDPGDSFYVIEAEEDDGYVVLDGNRRLCALLVLIRPDMLDGTNISEKIRDQLLDARFGFDAGKFSKIKCVCFKDPMVAKEWMLTRHTGSRGGEGRISWGSTEIQRFSGDGSIVDVIDFVGRSTDFAEGEWESLKSKIESGKSSVIGRLLESAAGRKHIGISITINPDGSKTPQLSRNSKWAASTLKKIMKDVVKGKVNSRSHNTAPQIEDYFESLPDKFQPKGKPIKPKNFKDINIKASQPQPKKSTILTSTTSGVPGLRKTLAPREKMFQTPTSERGKRLLREAKLIDADKFTISAAFILRAFVELAVNDYMDAKNMPKKPNGETLDLSQRADLVSQQIVKDGLASNADLRGFRNRVLKKSAASSIQSLNDFVHNKYQTPVPDEVRAGWDSCVPVFQAAYGKSNV